MANGSLNTHYLDSVVTVRLRGLGRRSIKRREAAVRVEMPRSPRRARRRSDGSDSSLGGSTERQHGSRQAPTAGAHGRAAVSRRYRGPPRRIMVRRALPRGRRAKCRANPTPISAAADPMLSAIMVALRGRGSTYRAHSRAGTVIANATTARPSRRRTAQYTGRSTGRNSHIQMNPPMRPPGSPNLAARATHRPTISSRPSAMSRTALRSFIART